MITLATFLLAFFPLESGTGHPTFSKQSFEDALITAKRESKLVFIDFYATWCGPCKVMDRNTYANEQVKTWLRQHTVPLKFDAELETALAKRYKVRQYPLGIFLDAEGKVLDRLIGLRDAKTFLEEAKSVLDGENAVTRARQALEKHGDQQPQHRLQLAKALAGQDQFAEALEHFLWCFDKGPASLPGFKMNLPTIVTDIAQISEHFPPAREALNQRSRSTREELLKGEPNLILFITYMAINQAQKTPQAMVDLYDAYTPGTFPDTYVPYILSYLAKAQRYTDLTKLKSPSEWQDETLQALDRLNQVPAASKTSPMWQGQLAMVLQSAATLYQVLLAVEKPRQAEKLESRLLAVDSSSETLNAVAYSAFLSGHATEKHLAMVRRALQEAKGNPVHMVDTEARLLAHLNRTAEARKLLNTYIGKTQGKPQKTLIQCLNDIEETSTKP